jgi:hypothetical protein
MLELDLILFHAHGNIHSVFRLDHGCLGDAIEASPMDEPRFGIWVIELVHVDTAITQTAGDICPIFRGPH